MRSYTFLARRLREARIKCDLSQSDVTQLLKYTGPQVLSNWERGVAPVPLRSLKKLIELYGLDVNAVIKDILTDKEVFLIRSLKGKDSSYLS